MTFQKSTHESRITDNEDCRVDLGMDSRLKRKLVDVVLGSCRGQFQVRLGLKRNPSLRSILKGIGGIIQNQKEKNILLVVC